MKKVIVTGSQGFIGSYICENLLVDHKVLGIDNYSKYGVIPRKHDNHPGFKLVKANLAISDGLKPIFEEFNPDYIIAGAAMIGGIAYFHKYAYDLISVNERIMANTIDIAIQLKNLKRLVNISSSMVYECATIFPSREDDVMPAPLSTYGMQKLMTEYFCKGAHQQYGLDYSIIRPFNCVGIGEEDVGTSLTHAIPDLIKKALNSKNGTMEILGNGDQVRHYTHGKDIAEGIRRAMYTPEASCQTFNISTPESISVTDLARIIWYKIYGNNNVSLIQKEPFKYDVQFRCPDVSKAREVLGFQSRICLSEALDEVIRWISTQK